MRSFVIGLPRHHYLCPGAGVPQSELRKLGALLDFRERRRGRGHVAMGGRTREWNAADVHQLEIRRAEQRRDPPGKRRGRQLRRRRPLERLARLRLHQLRHRVQHHDAGGRQSGTGVDRVVAERPCLPDGSPKAVGGSPGGSDHSPDISSIVNVACRTWLPAAGMHVAADICSAATRFSPARA